MVKIQSVKVEDRGTFPATLAGLTLAVLSDHPNCSDKHPDRYSDRDHARLHALAELVDTFDVPSR